MGTGDGAAAAMRQLKRPTMTDPRIEAMARAIKDHVDWDDNESIARIGLAAADAIDPVRKAARKVCIDSGDWTLGQAIDALGVALAAK